MRHLSCLVFLIGAATLGGCSTPGVTVSQEATASLAAPVSTASPHETVLLVSLEDGTVIKQTIHSNADFCFKNNADSLTTCLTQGAPILDPASNAIIGFEMIEDHIELIAKAE